MLRIILCDDNEEFLDRLQALMHAELARLEVQAVLCPFTEPERIPDSIVSGCDMALLDIDFPQNRCNGIDIARRIRARRPDAVILFISNYIEYAPEGYEVNAFRYVLKSEIARRLPGYLPEALEQLRATREALTIQCDGEQVTIALPEILWMESRQHTVTIRIPLKPSGVSVVNSTSTRYPPSVWRFAFAERIYT